MNRNLAGLLAATAGLALPMIAAAAPATDLVVLSPRLNDNEFIGPVAVVELEYDTPASAGLVVGQAIDAVGMYGVNTAGARVTSLVDVSAGIGGAPIFAANTAQSFTVDIAGAGASGTIDGWAGNPNIIAVEFVCSTEGTAGLVDGAGTAIDSADETVDETLEIDITGPMLTAVYTNTANDRLFFVFDEALQGAGGPGMVDTDLTNVDDTTFQFLATGSTNAFDNTTQTPNGAALTFTPDADFVDNAGDSNTTIGVDVTADDFPVGTIWRAAADDDGLPTHMAIYDLVGNEAGQGDMVVTGVLTTDTPTFEVLSACWTVGGGPGDTATMRVTFSLPVDGGSLGDSDYYGEVQNSLGNLLETSGGADFTVDSIGLDPDDTSSVLVDWDIDGGADDSITIWADGMSTDGETFKIATDSTGGTPPDSIFADSIGQDDTVDVEDCIEPTYLGLAFLDMNSDGELDAVAPFFDEPVTSDLAIGDVELNKDGGTVFPFAQITADGDLTEDDVENAADPDDDEITVDSTGSADISFLDPDVPSRLQVGNGQFFAFDPTGVDWDDDGNSGTDDTDGEATPGTGDSSVLTLDFTDATWSDPSGNETMNTLAAAAASVDRAAALFVSLCHYEGDNQLNGSNIQYWREMDDNVLDNPPGVPTSQLGDNQELDRLGIIFSEEMSVGGFDEDEVFVNGAPIFSGGPTIFTTDNAVTIQNDASGSDELQPGASVSIREGANITDDAGNPATVESATAVACTAPYVAFQSTIAGDVIHGAVAIDLDGNGFIDEVHFNFTENINASAMTTDDFEITSPADAPVTGISVGASDAEIILTLDNSPSAGISTVTPLEVRYNSNTADPLIEGANGAVSQLASAAADTNARIRPIDGLVNPSETGDETDNINSMLISGTITHGGVPAPIGTKVYGLVCVPVVDKITATHNGIPFTYERNGNHGDNNSFDAITNWLLGLEDHVYLHRGQNNSQWFSNYKDDGESFGGDGDDHAFVTDIIDLEFSFRSFTSITFRGTGESRDQTLSGTVTLCWDALRSCNGESECLWWNGYEMNGEPILSRAVVAGSDGRYELEVGAPSGLFTGRTKVSTADFPVIIVIELPNGERCAASSLLNAADGGGPILFQATLGTDVPSTFDFDVELNNIGKREIWYGWNAVGFDRASGVADSSLPTLPSGVLSTNVQTGLSRDLPAAGPFEQFVFWYDGFNGDGKWTAADDDDGPLDQIIVDIDCLPHFKFTMTNLGVQFGGDNITSLVGGYGFGILNLWGDLGCFQFGPKIAPGVPFSSFPASNTNLGWVLATVSQDIDVSGGVSALGGGADFAIQFINDDYDFFTRSAGTNSHGDLETVEDGSAVFIHYP
ncbi:MAG: hypothetical protein KDA20_02425 [Phycisphaerales bacterium]|nr:hypothetical protein [Phycisphaerales bacterium]